MTDKSVHEDTDQVRAITDDAATVAPSQPPEAGAQPNYYAAPPVPPPAAQYRQNPPPREGRGCGCWLAALFTLALVLALVGVGLFLPPVNLYDRLFGTRYIQLDAVNNGAATADNSLKLVLDPSDTGQTFGVLLNSVPLDAFQTANASAGAWIPAAKASVPPYLVPQSQIYDIQTTGDAPNTVTFDIQLPPNTAPTDAIDVYGYIIETGRWVFLPSQLNTTGSLTVTTAQIPDRIGLFLATAPDPAVIVPINITQMLTDEAAGIATVVSPAGMQPALDGSLVGSLAPGFNLNSGYRVMPVIRNFLDERALDPDTVAAIIGNRTARTAHIQQLTAFAGSGGFNGVFIDYRDLPVASRDDFSTFITELKTAFRATGLLLGVVVPPAQNQDGAWQTGAYDWRAIGDAADFVQINFDLDPSTFTPGSDRLVEAMVKWGVGEVSRYKLVMGINALSVRELGGQYAPVGYDEALAALGNVQIDTPVSESGIVMPGSTITARLDGFAAMPGLDTQLKMPFVEYLNPDNTKASTVWLMTAEALRARLEQFDAFGVGGIALNDLTEAGVAKGVLESILSYKLQLPAATESGELGLRWRVESADGTVAEVVTRLNEELQVTLAAEEGNFAINVEVIDGVSSSVRSGGAFSQFAPTATPTPLPTMTPTPQPTATSTLEPIIPTQPAAANNPPVTGGGGSPAIPPGSGSIAGGFEYGGHVTSTSSEVATGAMQQAGMQWMKVQHRYMPGNDPGALAGIIQEGRNRGFKVLLGIVGRPQDLRDGGAGYISGFAAYLGQVASYGPDAIEVWNESNISREWPEGSISGANYTSMLAQAYQAIKSANGSVMVISAAPAPTGAEAVYPTQVVNDDRYLRQMVDSGALNYLDCVGVHYNEGVVSPLQTSGDPRDNYYTRYLPTMIDVYWGIVGGAKPLCFTELGYLTPEGYGGLDPYFAWGQNTTVAQQAAWLAQAISFASQSGKVRMVIVWNVDFTAYGTDPQGGFAMVRPGGGCPACAAIAAAR